MDFLDPKKQKEHTIRLAIGYALMSVLLVLITTILLFKANGFGLDDRGHVIQNGLVFVTSKPDGASVFVNGKRYKKQTNTRIDLPSGQYDLQLRRPGYNIWKHTVAVEGGGVERFDYPLLFPLNVRPAKLKQYSAEPGLMTQSPDGRWLLVATTDQNTFDLYDLDSQDPAALPFTMSGDVLAAGSRTERWEVVEWAQDNRHVLLSRRYEQPVGSEIRSREYILLDRERPELSFNLSVLLGFSPSQIELRGQAYDQYYAFSAGTGQLFTASLKQPTPQPLLDGVVAFTSYSDQIAYLSSTDAPEGKVWLKFKDGGREPVSVRQFPHYETFVKEEPLLDIDAHGGSVYLVVGISIDGGVFVYKDLAGRLKDKPGEAPVPFRLLKIPGPSHVSFSADRQYIVVEGGDRFAVYDIETNRRYLYQSAVSPDMPQTYAVWLGDAQLGFVSGGKVVVFDFDGTNLQTLSPANPKFAPALDRNYRFVYALSADNVLTRAALFTPEDQ